MQLERLISILEMTAIAGRPVSVANLQKATGLPRPTCYRLVQTLTDHQLLDVEEPDSRFVIGERLIRLALLGKSDIDVRRATASTIKQAAIHLGEAAFLARLRNNHVEIIHVETPDDVTKSHIHPGLGNRPLHACSSAKAIAAHAEKELQAEILNGVLTQFTDHTHASPDTLAAEFAAIRACGYAQCNEEISLGIASVAAPVQFGTIGVAFSVGAVAHASHFDHENRKVVGEYLAKLAERVGSAIQLCNVTDI